MAYLMDEISEAATRRRLNEITASGVRALEECAGRSAEIDERARESNARQEAEIKAMERERDEREREAAPAGREQPVGPVPWQAREPKARVLSLGGEEFAEQANAPTPPTGFTVPPQPAAPLPAPQPPVPSRDRLLSFSVEEDEAPPPPPARPAPAPRARPRPSADGDDDFSDRSWMR